MRGISAKLLRGREPRGGILIPNPCAASKMALGDALEAAWILALRASSGAGIGAS